MIEILRLLKKIIMIGILWPMRFFKTKRNRVMFNNSLSHNYSGNIKALSEKILKEYPNKYELYLSVRDVNYEKNKVPDKIKVIKFHSFQYFFKSLTSGFYITNSGGYSYLPLSHKTIVINTWHGGGCYKKMGLGKKDVKKIHSIELKINSNKTTKFLSTCKRFSDAVKSDLLIRDETIMGIGMPRNDMLVNFNSIDTQEKIKSLKEKLNLKEKKLVLYAPTYRKVNSQALGEATSIEYGLDNKALINSLKKRFGGDWVLGVRFHPSISDEFIENDEIINFSKYDDMQDLILVADVMINDFSSSMWDFMLTKKPCFIYANDLEQYISTALLYTPIDEWPFDISNSNEELNNHILNFNHTKYLEKCDLHYKLLGGCETGEATDIIVNYMNDVLDK